jgi:hypothetical protein
VRDRILFEVYSRVGIYVEDPMTQDESISKALQNDQIEKWRIIQTHISAWAKRLQEIKAQPNPVNSDYPDGRPRSHI